MQGGNDSKKVSVKNNLHEFELVMNYTKFFKDKSPVVPFHEITSQYS